MLVVSGFIHMAGANVPHLHQETSSKAISQSIPLFKYLSTDMYPQ